MKKVLIAYAVEREKIALSFKDCTIDYVYTGVGKVASSIALMDAIDRYQPDLVLNIGTAGALRHAIGTIKVCTHFIDRDFQKEPALELNFELDSKDLLLSSGFCNAWDVDGICNTGDSFVTSLSDATHDDVFEMEAFAEASVCAFKKRPFVAIKYVTDIIGQNSLKLWEDKLADARTELTTFFADKEVL